MRELEVRRGHVADIEEIVDLLAQTAAWLTSKGVQQWPARFPTELVAAGVARGEVFVARQQALPVATLTLQWYDHLWGGDGVGAGYLHRLAVRPTSAGQGLGGFLLDWAAQRVAAAGRSRLRLDCVAHNRRLRTWYETNGFEWYGDVECPTWRHSLYERSVDVSPGLSGAVSQRRGPP